MFDAHGVHPIGKALRKWAASQFSVESNLAGMSGVPCTHWKTEDGSSPMTLRHWMVATAVVAGTVALTACGSGAKDEAGSTASGTTTASVTNAQAAATVGVQTLGGRQALADGSGRALYLFTKDTPGHSACAGECLVKWPAVTAAVTAGTGIDAAKLGTLTRADGSAQASYAGKPLYYFAGDKNPGDTAGQGVMDVWFLLDAQGEAIR